MISFVTAWVQVNPYTTIIHWSRLVHLINVILTAGGRMAGHGIFAKGLSVPVTETTFTATSSL